MCHDQLMLWTIRDEYLKQKPQLIASMPPLLHLNHLESELGPNLKTLAHLVEFYLRGYKPHENSMGFGKPGFCFQFPPLLTEKFRAGQHLF